MGTIGAPSATVPVKRRNEVISQARRSTSVYYACPLTLDKVDNALPVLLSSLLTDEVDLVLEDNNVLKLHDLDGSQVLRGLGLRARLVTGNEEESSVHDSGTVKHGGHENVVSGAVDERDVTEKVHPARAAGNLAWWVVLLVGGI